MLDDSWTIIKGATTCCSLRSDSDEQQHPNKVRVFYIIEKPPSNLMLHDCRTRMILGVTGKLLKGFLFNQHMIGVLSWGIFLTIIILDVILMSVWQWQFFLLNTFAKQNVCNITKCEKNDGVWILPDVYLNKYDKAYQSLRFIYY